MTAGARHVEPSALHGIVGTRGDGRSAASTRRAFLPRFERPRKEGGCSYLQALARAGLVTFKRAVGQWTFSKRDQASICALKKEIRVRL